MGSTSLFTIVSISVSQFLYNSTIHIHCRHQPDHRQRLQC